MPDLDPRCATCPLLFCDFVSRDCRLSAGEVVRFRRDLLRPRKPFVVAIAMRRKRRAALGFKKYDRRYKGHSDATQRLVWRNYKAISASQGQS